MPSFYNTAIPTREGLDELCTKLFLILLGQDTQFDLIVLFNELCRVSFLRPLLSRKSLLPFALPRFLSKEFR